MSQVRKSLVKPTTTYQEPILKASDSYLGTDSNGKGRTSADMNGIKSASTSSCVLEAYFAYLNAHLMRVLFSSSHPRVAVSRRKLEIFLSHHPKGTPHIRLVSSSEDRAEGRLQVLDSEFSP